MTRMRTRMSTRYTQLAVMLTVYLSLPLAGLSGDSLSEIPSYPMGKRPSTALRRVTESGALPKE